MNIAPVRTMPQTNYRNNDNNNNQNIAFGQTTFSFADAFIIAKKTYPQLSYTELLERARIILRQATINSKS